MSEKITSMYYNGSELLELHTFTKMTGPYYTSTAVNMCKDVEQGLEILKKRQLSHIILLREILSSQAKLNVIYFHILIFDKKKPAFSVNENKKKFTFDHTKKYHEIKLRCDRFYTDFTFQSFGNEILKEIDKIWPDKKENCDALSYDIYQYKFKIPPASITKNKDNYERVEEELRLFLLAHYPYHEVIVNRTPSVFVRYFVTLTKRSTHVSVTLEISWVEVNGNLDKTKERIDLLLQSSEEIEWARFVDYVLDCKDLSYLYFNQGVNIIFYDNLKQCGFIFKPYGGFELGPIQDRDRLKNIMMRSGNFSNWQLINPKDIKVSTPN